MIALDDLTTCQTAKHYRANPLIYYITSYYAQVRIRWHRVSDTERIAPSPAEARCIPAIALQSTSLAATGHTPD